MKTKNRDDEFIKDCNSFIESTKKSLRILKMKRVYLRMKILSAKI